MKKEHPEVIDLKNVCDTSKTPKQVCDVVKKDEKKKEQSKKDNKL